MLEFLVLVFLICLLGVGVLVITGLLVDRIRKLESFVAERETELLQLRKDVILLRQEVRDNKLNP